MKCSRKDVCDDVTWELDEVGAKQMAIGIEGCDRFDIHEDSMLEHIAEEILATDMADGDYADIKVSRDTSTIQVYLILSRNLTSQDKTERMQELQDMLQGINDEVLHIKEVEFLIHCAFLQVEMVSATPAGVDENGNIIEIKSVEKVSPDAAGERTYEGEQLEEVTPQSECPVCETTMTDECPKCGFRW